MPRLCEVSFHNGKLTLRQRFLSEVLYMDHAFEPLATELKMAKSQGADLDSTVAFVDSLPETPTWSQIADFVVAAENPQEALLDVLALMREFPRQKFFMNLSDLEKKLYFTYTEEDVIARKDGYLQDASFTALQNTYASVLSDAITRYSNLELTQNGSDFLMETGEPLTIAGQYADSGLTDADTKLAFICSEKAFLCVETLHIPSIQNVPRVKKYTEKNLKSLTEKGIFYTLCLITRMPDGRPAVVYFTSGNIFTVCEISEDQYAEWMGQTEYVSIISDELSKTDFLYYRDKFADGMYDAYYFVH